MFKGWNDKKTENKSGNSEKEIKSGHADSLTNKSCPKMQAEISASQDKLFRSYDANMELLRRIFSKDETIVFREFQTQHQNSPRICAVFANGMTDKNFTDKNIICPIQKSSFQKQEGLDLLMNKVVISTNVERASEINQIVECILYGDTLLIIESEPEALIFDTKGWKQRSVSEPTSENVVRGPREGFTESVLVNVALIRKRILDPELKFHFRQIGVRSRTRVCICYIEGIVNSKIVDEVNRRLDSIEIDAILESGYIEELIQDTAVSPFSSIGSSERPDKVAANILEGRVALIVDGTPMVLTLPFLFIEYFQASEDYYNHFIYAAINRILRLLSFFLSTSLPAVYVAMTTFHHEMIPTPLLLSISAAREGVPFPTIVEVIIMLVVFEIIREGGARLPSSVGSTISFVGALVLGDAAVNARIVSAPIVIIVALTGLTNFLLPHMTGALNIVRLMFIFAAGFLGLYGYIYALIGLFIHLTSMRSFGVPYMLSIGDLKFQDIKDTAIRSPWWLMQLRPKLIALKNRVRERAEKK